MEKSTTAKRSSTRSSAKAASTRSTASKKAPTSKTASSKRTAKKVDFFDAAESSAKVVATGSLGMAADVAKVSESVFRGYVAASKAGMAFLLAAEKEVVSGLDVDSKVSETVADRVSTAADAWVDAQKASIGALLSVSEEVARFWTDNAEDIAKANADLIRKMAAAVLPSEKGKSTAK